jgi:hypothetical protein
VVSSVLNKTMDQMTGEMVDKVLLRAQQRQRFTEEQEGFSGFNINFMEMDRRGGEHGRYINVKPFVLTWWQVALIEGVQKGMEACISGDLLLGHEVWTA